MSNNLTMDEFKIFKEFLKNIPFLTGKDCSLFEPYLKTKNYKAKNLFLSEGKTCQEIGFVNKGCFRTYYLSDGKVQAVINSSLGNGTGTTDTEFRKSVLTMNVPNASNFMPYNKFRITQNYNYEKGELTETVELFKEKDGKEIPFMKNEEIALIFIKGKLDIAPTTFKQ